MCLCISINDEFLAAGGFDGKVHVWEIATGNIVFRGAVHEDEIRTIAFAPSGSRFVVAGGVSDGLEDYTVRIWDAISFREVARLWEHKYSVWSVAYSPRGDAQGDGERSVPSHGGILDASV